MPNLPLALLLTLAALPAAAAPLTLDEALSTAARNNADLALARSARDVAAVDTGQSYSGLLPRLDLTGGFGRQYAGSQRVVTSAPVFDGAGNLTGFEQRTLPISAGESAAHQAALTLRWTLFDGLSSWRRVGAAQAAEEASARQLDESTLQIAFEVTRRFYELLKQERALRVREEAVERSEELVRRADALYTAGRGTKADTFAARVNLGNDRIAVESQRAAVVRARTDLAMALGLSEAPAFELVAPAPVAGPGLPSFGEPPPLPDLLALARQRRPLLSARAAGVSAAEQQSSQARGAFWPVVGLQGTYQRAGPELTGSYGVLGSPAHQYAATAQLTLAWNLFAGRETLAAARKAELGAERARVEASQAGQQVAAEVARAREAVVTLARSSALAQDNLAAADQGLSLARERLEAGVASQLEVRDATQKLAEAKLALVSALVDHAVARADLARAVGGAL
ncbi:MAG: TolC family protein [Deltaproteobacteria bacterium]|nr:TolC family protein [Deltaproteobacteria bacterium]